MFFYLESRLPTLIFLFIVNVMNVQYDTILTKDFPVICGVIVQMFWCVLIRKQIRSVGLAWSVADDLWHCWNIQNVKDLCLFDCAQPRQKKQSAFACLCLCGKMMGHARVTLKHLLSCAKFSATKGTKVPPSSTELKSTIYEGLMLIYKAEKTH